MKKNFSISLIIFFISLLIFLANSWGLSIYSLDEAKNSECAREMLERGDFIVPTFNYELRTDKPPLHYYFMILGYKIFGVNEFSARFFSAVFGALTVLITYLISARYLGTKIGLLSVLVLISSLHTAIQFHMAVPDPYLIFFINASLFSFLYGFEERKKFFIYLFYVFTAFGVLSKGPVAVVLPSFIIFLYLIFTKNLNLKNLKYLSMPLGISLILLISLPWYIAVYIKTNGLWLKDFILHHNLERFSKPLEGHGGIFLTTFLYVFVGLLPFSIFILQSLRLAFKDKKNRLILFSIIFSLTYILFFAISKTKLPNYTVPAYPPLAILIGYYLSKIEFSKRLSILISLIVYTVLTVLIPVALYTAISKEKPISDLNYLSFYFFLWFIGGLLAIILSFKDKRFIIPSLSISSIVLTLMFFFYIFPKIDNRNPVKHILPLMDKSQEIYYYGGFNPAFLFYIRKRIPPLEDRLIYTDKEFYILSRKKFIDRFKNVPEIRIIKVAKDLFEKHYSVLLKKD